jgi:hypothetical protein
MTLLHGVSWLVILIKWSVLLFAYSVCKILLISSKLLSLDSRWIYAFHVYYSKVLDYFNLHLNITYLRSVRTFVLFLDLFYVR